MEPDHIHLLKMDCNAKFSKKLKWTLLSHHVFQWLPAHTGNNKDNKDILYALTEINISGKILLMQSVVFSYSIIRTNLASEMNYIPTLLHPCKSIFLSSYEAFLSVTVHFLPLHNLRQLHSVFLRLRYPNHY